MKTDLAKTGVTHRPRKRIREGKLANVAKK
jgi:hypothetical protein